MLDYLQKRSRAWWITTSIVMVLWVGAIDYWTGFELSVSVVYLLPIALAVWFVGRGPGIVLSVCSVIVWLCGDVAAGARYSSPFVPIWNALILLLFFLVVVLILASLRRLQDELEERVRERTAALRTEMTERERLEREILATSEREQQRIGHDLHDSLCQHLTAAALAGEVLAEKLKIQASPVATDAQQVVTMVEDGITLARNLAHGLAPALVRAEGLMEAFAALAAQTSEQFRVACRFECDAPVLVAETATATHLYRIAQEAISNAVRHGHARQIVIRLTATEAGRVLEIADDGRGLPEPLPAGNGMGLRIMAHRATMIGGTFAVRRGEAGGTVVSGTWP